LKIQLNQLISVHFCRLAFLLFSCVRAIFPFPVRLLMNFPIGSLAKRKGGVGGRDLGNERGSRTPRPWAAEILVALRLIVRSSAIKSFYSDGRQMVSISQNTDEGLETSSYTFSFWKIITVYCPTEI